VADLLECLIQIKGLAETPSRVAAAVELADEARWRARPSATVWAPIEVLGHLADLELVFGVRLRAMLTLDEPALAQVDGSQLVERARYLDWPLTVALDRFTRRRRENLELLDGCSAEDLNRTGVHPSRGRLSVADLVAVMLAHDTDHVGQIRSRLGVSGSSLDSAAFSPSAAK
jgi:uncharacterized damage-inducible protein DinB